VFNALFCFSARLTSSLICSPYDLRDEARQRLKLRID
jgi:hypothetical protein